MRGLIHKGYTVALWAVLMLFHAQVAFAEGGAGEVLQGLGLAAIIAAASQPATTAISAAADVKIAGINSRTTLESTQMATELSKYQSDNLKDIALNNAYTTKEINALNQSGQTERLGMMLMAQASANASFLALEREKLMVEAEFRREQIRMAYRKLEDDKKLAQLTIEAKLTAAGLMPGFKTTDSSKGLTITRSGMAKQPDAQPLPAQTGADSSAKLDPLTGNGGMAFMGASTPLQRPASNNQSTRLLASVRAANFSSGSRASFSDATASLTNGSFRESRLRADRAAAESRRPDFRDWVRYTPSGRASLTASDADSHVSATGSESGRHRLPAGD